MKPPVPANEPARLAALALYEIIDTEPEQAYDNVTTIAAQICATPIALVSLVTAERQWFKSRVGLDACETPRDQAFCAHAIVGVEPLIVPDAAKDARFRDNPLVTGAPHVRFYAGVPLYTPDGYALGTLCVIDREPRTLTPAQLNALCALARQIESQLALRRIATVLACANSELELELSRRREAEAALQGEATYVKLLQAVALAANESPTLEAAMQICLDEVCARTHWPAGHVYLCAQGAASTERQLIPTAIWHLDDPVRYAPLRAAISRTRLNAGQDLPGQVMETKRTVWVSDFAEKPEHARHRFGADISVRSGFAFPVLVGDEVVAVFEFYASDPSEISKRLLETASLVGVQIGRAFERNLAQTAMRAGEERYRQIFEHASDIIFKADRNGRFTLFNDMAVSLLGYTREELGAMRWLDLVHPEHRAAVRRHYLQQFKSRTPGTYLEFPVVTKEGGQLWLGLKTGITYAGRRATGFQATARDLTNLRRAEERVRQSEARFRAGTQSTSEAIISADGNGNIRFWNRGAQHIFGYEESDALGRPLAIITPERYRGADLRGLERHVGKTVELQGLRQDGSEFPLELSLSTWRTNEGTFYSGIIRDISERKWIEAELKQARDAALESARLKSEFLANMSHEIRTPMNGVIGMTGLLLDTELSAEQREFAETINHSADSLLTIINDILDFSKIEAGKLQFETLDFELHQVVEGVGELLAEAAQAKGVELIAYVRSKTPARLRSDPGRLRQVLTNLVSNAVKFTEAGEVIVEVSCAGETETHAELRFEVTDSGIGISPEAQCKLFQAFVQADGSTTRKYGGTGLGLAISKQIVELLEGEIGVESAPGRGSRFWFTLRLEKQPAQADATAPRTDLEGLRVLFVDDHAVNRRMLREQADAWNMKASEAQTAAQALRQLRVAAQTGASYDLAVLDYRMPEMDGLDLARVIKNDPALAPVRLVLMTAFNHRGHGDAARQAGVAASLTKPLRQTQLFECLANVMNEGKGDVSTARASSATTTALITRHKLTVTAAAVEQLRGRVLLVEDSIVNQKVARRQVEKFGYHVDVAHNGLDALEALARSVYTVVLMDCQMPEMDGYETTREVRRREGATRRTPIIAMTANALQGDRERCLAAGMDDYLSKPVKPCELEAMLDFWATGGRQADAPPGTTTAARQFARSEADTGAHHPEAGATQVTRRLGELRAEFDDEMVADLIDTFLIDTTEHVEALRRAVEGADAKAVAREAHRLKGGCHNLGAADMSRLCAQMEEAADRGGSTRGADSLLQQIERSFERVQTLLEAEGARITR